MYMMGEKVDLYLQHAITVVVMRNFPAYSCVGAGKDSRALGPPRGSRAQDSKVVALEIMSLMSAQVLFMHGHLKSNVTLDLQTLILSPLQQTTLLQSFAPMKHRQHDPSE